MDTIVSHPAVSGSHRVSHHGEKVVLHDVEVFCGFDPDIDDGSDERVKKWTADRVREAVDRTGLFIARGQSPKVVIRHDSDGDAAPPEAVGDCLSIRAADRGKATYVLMDLEFQSTDFEALIRTNKYPRRSAEIWPDGHISEVALLGRETPGRPLPDTKFAKAGEAERWERRLTPLRFAAVHPGATNAFVPSAAGDDSMDDKMRELEEENSRLRSKVAEYEKDPEDEGEDEEFAATDEDDQPDVEIPAEDEEEENGRAKYGKAGSKALFAKIQSLKKDNDELGRIVKDLSTDLAREKFARQIDEMKSDGFAVGKFRDQMIEELIEAKDPKAKVVFWKSTLRKEPIGRYVDQTNTQAGGGKPSDSALDAARARAKVRAQDEGPEKFSAILREEISRI